MRDLLLMALGFLLVCIQAALGTVLDVGALMPNMLLPIVIYLGMAPDISLARGATISFMLGLMLDSACGNAMGLFTFVHVASLLVARGTGFRLLMRGRISQVLITSALALAGAGALVALRSIFRPRFSFEAVSRHHVAVALLAPSLATGALAPFVFRLVRRVDGFRRRDEPQAMP